MDKQRRLRTLLADQRGATAVEYGLIISLIVIAMFAGMTKFANTTIAMWNSVVENVSTNS